MKAKSLLIFISCCFVSTLALAQGVWTQKANFGGTSRVWGTGFSIGNKGYIGTGYDSNNNNTQDFWEWDQGNNTWTQKANFPGIARSHAVSFSIGTKGYIGTGLINNTSTCFKDFWEYDPLTNTWTQKADVGGALRYRTAGFSIGYKGYIGTGWDGNTHYKDFWEWDQATNTWTQKADFGGGVREMSVGFSIGTKGYIGTGVNNSGPCSDFWEWDQTTNIWTQKTSYGGGAIYMAIGFSIGNKGYIGTGTDNSNYLKDFWEWNQTTNLWTKKANIGGSIREGAVGFAIGNKGYIGTGGWMYNDFWEFDPQDTTLSLLNGSVFHDANANCIQDAGDTLLANWFVKAQNTTTLLTFYGTTSTNGIYKIEVPSGSYSISLVPKAYWNQVCPASNYTASVIGHDTVSNLNFGATISNYCPDLAVSIGASTTRRCMKNNYYVQYWNNGTTNATNVLLKVNFDPKIIPLSSSIPWDSISGTSYFWKVASVQPNQFVTINVLDSISCNAQLGDKLNAYAQWLNITSDCDPGNNVDEDINTVIGSHDPNDKLASTTTNTANIKQANILPTDTLNYIIHFQNTGTDTAFKVVVYDTLDPHLNATSVISGVASNPYTFELLGAGVLKWTFNNILLADSNINELASHGFIKFKILQKANNPDGTVIKNSAGIVFDFNTPVITDTVVLTINTHASVANVTGEENVINIYPNPTTGLIAISCPENATGIFITDILGRRIYQSTNSQISKSTSIDLSSAPAGIYFLNVRTQNGTLVSKIIRE